MLAHRVPLALMLIVSSSPACIDEGARHDGTAGVHGAEGADEVGQLSLALGGFTALYTQTGGSQLNVGDTYSVFDELVSGCDRANIVLTTTGALTSLTQASGCASYTAAASDSGVYLGDSAGQKIVQRVPTGFGGAGSGGGPSPGALLHFINTPGNSIAKILLSSTHVYWKDSAGIHRASRTSPAITTLAPSNRTLRGIDGGVLYVEVPVSGGFSLRTLPVAGGAETQLFFHTGRFSNLTFDTQHFYWVEGISSVNRLRRLTKSGTNLTTVRESSTVFYEFAYSNGSALYWREENVATRAAKIRRQNLSNGNIVSADFPMFIALEMLIRSDAIYVIGTISQQPSLRGLMRTAL
jgi:hypothetical protein